MAANHSEMLNAYQATIRNVHILQIAKVPQNEEMDSHSIRRENLMLILAEVGTKAELARLAGVSTAYLSQVTSDTTKRNIGPDVARRIERATGRKRGWMDIHHPAEAKRKTTDVIALAWIPIVDWTAAASPLVHGEAPMKIPTTAIVAGRQLSPKAFALRVKGDAMVNPSGGRPSYPPGCIIIIDPDRKPRSDDRVLVQIPEAEEPAFKVFTQDAGRIFLRSLNPQYPALPWSEGMNILGVIVQTVIDE